MWIVASAWGAVKRKTIEGEEVQRGCRDRDRRNSDPNGLGHQPPYSADRGGLSARGALVLHRPRGARGLRRHPLRAGGRGRRAARLARGQAAAGRREAGVKTPGRVLVSVPGRVSKCGVAVRHAGRFNLVQAEHVLGGNRERLHRSVLLRGERVAAADVTAAPPALVPESPALVTAPAFRVRGRRNEYAWRHRGVPVVTHWPGLRPSRFTPRGGGGRLGLTLPSDGPRIYPV
jgi:hypothetical protein